MAPIYSFISQLGIDTNNPVTVRYDFKRCTLGVDEEFLDTNGNRGTRSRYIDHVRQGMRRIRGQLQLSPTPVEWSTLLPWILGGSPSGSGAVTYPLADALPGYYVAVDKSNGTNGKVMTYNSVRINKWTLRGQQGQVLDTELDLVGVDETIGNAGTFPNLSIDTTTAPFVFMDLTLSINSTTVQAKNFELSVDNKMDEERFFNSQTLSAAANAQDRHVTLNCSLPYGDATALYDLGAAGISAVATFTGGGSSVLTLTMANVAFPRKPIEVPERQEEMLPLQGIAYQSGSTKELVVTLHT